MGDTKKHGTNCVIDKKKPHRIVCGTNNSQNIALCGYEIKRKGSSKDTFAWEIEVHQYSNYSWFGFVDSRSFVRNYQYFLGQKDGVYSIGIGANALSTSSYQGLQSRTVKLQMTPQIGDRFKFKVNWKRNTVDVYHNGKVLSVLNRKTALFDNMRADCIIPAVSSNTTPAEYTIRWVK